LQPPDDPGGSLAGAPAGHCRKKPPPTFLPKAAAFLFQGFIALCQLVIAKWFLRIFAL